MKKMVASDYDGTLNRGGISAQTVKMIQELQKQGHVFGVVTGRDYVRGYEVFKKNGEFPFDFIICHNGSVGVDADGRVLFAASVDGQMKWGESTLVQELVKRCLELTKNPCGVSFETSRLDFCPADYVVPDQDTTVYSPLSVLKEVGTFSLSNAICEDDEQAARVTAILKAEFGEVLNPLQNGRCIDISPAGVDKCYGIERCAKLMGVACNDIWTAGDNYNDVSMLKKYHGCAMPNAPERVRTAAEYVCDGVDKAIQLVLETKKT